MYLTLASSFSAGYQSELCALKLTTMTSNQSLVPSGGLCLFVARRTWWCRWNVDVDYRDWWFPWCNLDGLPLYVRLDRIHDNTHDCKRWSCGSGRQCLPLCYVLYHSLWGIFLQMTHWTETCVLYIFFLHTERIHYFGTDLVSRPAPIKSV